jgi:uncharacterized protein (DUF433 family)
MAQQKRRQPVRVTVEQVAEMAQAGYTNREIADRYGVTPWWVGELRKRTGIPEPKPTKYPREVWVKVEAWLADGWPVQEIAPEVGMNKETILDRYPGAGKNGKAWRNVQRWAQSHCPDLLEDIKRMEVT